MLYIAFDVHKRYALAGVEEEQGRNPRQVRIEHEAGKLKRFPSTCEPSSQVAVETTGNWHWIVEEIEAAGMKPRLGNALKVKHMLSSENKTDRLDARGLNVLQRSGTLPACGSHLHSYPTYGSCFARRWWSPSYSASLMNRRRV